MTLMSGTDRKEYQQFPVKYKNKIFVTFEGIEEAQPPESEPKSDLLICFEANKEKSNVKWILILLR